MEYEIVAGNSETEMVMDPQHAESVTHLPAGLELTVAWGFHNWFDEDPYVLDELWRMERGMALAQAMYWF